MNIDELYKLRLEIMEVYEKEKNDNYYVDDELNDIKRELGKIDKLIYIYQKKDKNFIVMKLERLYMMLFSNYEESQFESLNEEQIFSIFDKFFPKEWIYKYSLEEKEQLLLDAICKNRVINCDKILEYRL